MLALTNWNPWSDVADLHRDLDVLVGRMFGDIGRSSGLTTANASVEINREGDGWKVAVPVPGIEPEHIAIEVDGRTLHIRGEQQRNDGRNGAAYGRLEQQLTLPGDIDTEKVTARYHLGMLELTLPLKESAKPRRISIDTTKDVRQLHAA